METTTHRNLKRLAAAHLLREGYQAVGIEVRCPGSRYRVDVAGYMDRLRSPGSPSRESAVGRASPASLCNAQRVDEAGTARPTPSRESQARRAPEKTTHGSESRGTAPQTIIIECKQSRGDFIRDDRRADELIALREELRGWQQHIEENRIKKLEPELRRSGTALFAELEEWDFSASRLGSYKKLLRRIRAVEKQLYGQTKFARIAQYRLANRLCVCIPRGLIRKREAPPGWGVIEFERDMIAIDNNGAQILIDAPQRSVRPDIQLRLLRNIAIAATRHACWNQQVNSTQEIHRDTQESEIG